MLRKHILNKDFFTLSADFISSSIILFNTLTWFYIIRAIINNALQNPNNLLFFATFNFTIIFSSLLGAFVAGKVKRIKILYLWVILGVMSSLFTMFLDINVAYNMPLIAFLLGFSFGFGMPSSLAYFADCTSFENRGRSSGLLFSISIIGSFLFLSCLGESWFGVLFASAIWRTLGLSVLFVLKPTKTNREPKVRTHPSFRSILSIKPFIYFIIPWFLFSVIDSIERPYFLSLVEMSNATDFIAFDEIFEPLIGVLFAFIGGLVADLIGRKKVIIYGFLSLGLTFAILSLAPTMQVFWYVVSAVDATAWGIFYVMFVLVLWGDLSSPGSLRERYYAIGNIPFFLAELVGAIVYPLAQGVSKETIYAAFPIASFFLFLAVLPLMYAPETLPEKKIKERELKKYIEKAKKIKEKSG